MSEQNIYKEHYELQQSHALNLQSLQNIYNALYAHVSPEGVQLSLQEVLDLVLAKLEKVGEKIEVAVEDEVKKVTKKADKV